MACPVATGHLTSAYAYLWQNLLHFPQNFFGGKEQRGEREKKSQRKNETATCQELKYSNAAAATSRLTVNCFRMPQRFFTIYIQYKNICVRSWQNCRKKAREIERGRQTLSIVKVQFAVDSSILSRKEMKMVYFTAHLSISISSFRLYLHKFLL